MNLKELIEQVRDLEQKISRGRGTDDDRDALVRLKHQVRIMGENEVDDAYSSFYSQADNPGLRGTKTRDVDDEFVDFYRKPLKPPTEDPE